MSRSTCNLLPKRISLTQWTQRCLAMFQSGARSSIDAARRRSADRRQLFHFLKIVPII